MNHFIFYWGYFFNIFNMRREHRVSKMPIKNESFFFIGGYFFNIFNMRRDARVSTGSVSKQNK
jgi:hypothetical protein